MTAFNVDSMTVAQLKQQAIATAHAQLEQLAQASQEIGELIEEGLEAFGYAAADAVELAVDIAQSEEAKAMAVKALKGAKVVGLGLVVVSMALLMALLYLGKACHWAYHLCERWDAFAEVSPQPDPVLEAGAAAIAVARVLLELLVAQLYGEVAQVVAMVRARAMAVAIAG